MSIFGAALIMMGRLRHGDVLLQRISGTKENLGRPYFVEKSRTVNHPRCLIFSLIESEF